MGRTAKWPPEMREHASGRARVCWRGQEYYVGPWGSDEAKREHAALLVRLAAEEGKPRITLAAGRTVEAVIGEWVKEILPQLAEKAQYDYRTALTVLVRVAGHMAAAEFEAGDLDRVRAAMLSGKWIKEEERESHGLRDAPTRKGRKPMRTPKARGPWCPAHADRMASRIKTVWRWLELRKHVPKGSWSGLLALKKLADPSQGEEGPAWTRRQGIAVSVSMKRSPCRRMLLAQLWSGCRSKEVRTMLWSEIDRAGRVWMWRPKRHKNAWRGHRRCIALGLRAQAVLNQQRRKEPKGDLVFPCRHRGRLTGKAYSASAYACCVRTAAARIGLAGFHAYAVRHLARERFEVVAGLQGARAALGHASADTTVGYGRRQDEELAAQVALKAG